MWSASYNNWQQLLLQVALSITVWNMDSTGREGNNTPPPYGSIKESHKYWFAEKLCLCHMNDPAFVPGLACGLESLRGKKTTAHIVCVCSYRLEVDTKKTTDPFPPSLIYQITDIRCCEPRPCRLRLRQLAKTQLIISAALKTTKRNPGGVGKIVIPIVAFLGVCVCVSLNCHLCSDSVWVCVSAERISGVMKGKCETKEVMRLIVAKEILQNHLVPF